MRINHSLIVNKRLLSGSTSLNKCDVEVRVRFAPSPTGNIHLGGLRTALYNYIFAKQRGGKFMLRIEDTDQTRVVPGALDNLEHVLNWAGLRSDESPKIGGPYGPYLQSARLSLYKEKAYELIELGKAYRCFCSPIRLELLRKHQVKNKEKPRYDGKCKHMSPSQIEDKLKENKYQHAIRFSLQPGSTIFDDMIFGKINNDLLLESDPIILKSDSYPTYHFANVVDDHMMKISHVLRGSEWISSTAKHVQLYQAFGWTQPTFAHFPLITMKDGSKMSKRSNHNQVSSLIELGYRPRALINFLTNMGGGLPKEKQDKMDLWDLEKIVENFNFAQVSCHPASVDLDRLNKYNNKDLQDTWIKDQEKVLNLVRELLGKNNVITDLDDDDLTRIIDRFIGRITTLNDLLTWENIYIWQHPNLDWSLQEYKDKGWDLSQLVKSVIAIVEHSNLEDKISLDLSLKELATTTGVHWPSMMRFLRKLLTNSETGLPVYEIFQHLGKIRLLDYLYKGLKYVNQ